MGVRDQQLAAGEAAGRGDGQGQGLRVEPARFLQHRKRADALSHGQGGEQIACASPPGRAERGRGDDGARDERAREASPSQLLDEGEGLAD